MRERFREIDAIFDAALDVALHERDTFITQRCGDDVGLRAEVRALLNAHTRSGDFLEAPAVQIGASRQVHDAHAAATDLPHDAERAGAHGRHRLVGGGGLFQQRCADLHRRGLEEVARPGMRVQECSYFGAEADVIAAALRDERVALVRREVEGGVEDRVDLSKALARGMAHVTSFLVEELAEKPALRLRPIPLGRAKPDAERLGRFFLGHAAEEAALDHARLARVELAQAVERLVERDEQVGAFVGTEVEYVERHGSESPAALEASPRSRSIHQNATHGRRGDAHEVRAAGPLDARLVDQRRYASCTSSVVPNVRPVGSRDRCRCASRRSSS